MDSPPAGPRAPALRLAVYLAAGILLGRLFLPPSWLIWSAALVPVAILIFMLRRSGGGSTPAALAPIAATILCVLIGVARYAEVSQSLPSLPPNLLRKSAVISGIIADDPSLTGDRCRFPLACREIGAGGMIRLHTARVLVTLRLPVGTPERGALRYGMHVVLRGKLDRPSSARNPGEFDARSYYEANGITLLLRVRAMDSVTVLGDHEGDWWMRSLVLPVRRSLLDQIDRTVGGDEGEFLKGLLIGERSGLSYSLRDAFVRSGTAHVLAVSGSNVAVIAAIVLLLLQFVRANRWVRAVLTCVAVVFYMLLTGGQPPVVRAGIMAIVLLGAGLVQERPNTLNSLGIAAGLILLLDPRQLFDVGFELSFAAVFSIVLLYPPMRTRIDRWTAGLWMRRLARPPLRLVALSLAATIGTLPLSAMWFGSVSIIGLLANIVVVPAVGVSVVLGVASGMAAILSSWMAQAYASLNTIILRFTIWTAQETGALSFATLDTPAFRWVDAIAFYAAVAVFLQKRGKVIAGLIVLALALHLAIQLPDVPWSRRTPGCLRVTFIDVGQGDAALIELPEGHAILVDAGGMSTAYDAGERVVVPFLRRCGIRSLDALVVTHYHSDHAGGVPAVLRSVRVDELIEPDTGREGTPTAAAGVRSGLRHSGRIGGELKLESQARVFILSPGAEGAAGEGQTGENNSSVVLKVCYGSVSFLLAGDAGTDVEALMLEGYGGFLRSTVLKVGHHGSSGSSSESFLDVVRPEQAVISVGAGNSFGHPSGETLGRLEGRGIGILRTDEEGAVMFETDGRVLRRIEWK
jgi:competence protein ComEC